MAVLLVLAFKGLSTPGLGKNVPGSAVGENRGRMNLIKNCGQKLVPSWAEAVGGQRPER